LKFPEDFINKMILGDALDLIKYFWQVVLYCPEGRVKSPIGYTKYTSYFRESYKNKLKR